MAVKIGAHVRALREGKQLTQAELAALVGLHQATIANIENDVKRPSVQTLVALAAVLGVTTDSLLQGEPVA